MEYKEEFLEEYRPKFTEKAKEYYKAVMETTLDEPKIVLVDGRPGTGKTTWALNRMMDYIDSGEYGKDEIGYFGFSRASARCITERLTKAYDIETWKQFDDTFPWVRTIHSACRKVLMLGDDNYVGEEHLTEYSMKEGLDFEPFKFRKIQDIDYHGMVEEFVPKSGNVLFNWYQRLKRTKIYDEDIKDALKEVVGLTRRERRVLRRATIERVVDIYEDWGEWKKERSLYEYDDMLQEVFIDQRHPDDGNLKVMFVDEAHDLTNLSFSVVMLWSECCSHTYMLYDPLQSIYGFMGASSALVDNLKPEPDVVLDTTYRSPPNILEEVKFWAHKVNDTRIDKVRSVKNDEGIVDTIERSNLRAFLELVDFHESSFMLLRYNDMVKRMLQQLYEFGIPVLGLGRTTTLWDKHSRFREVYNLVVRLAQSSRGNTFGGDGVMLPPNEVEAFIRDIPVKGNIKYGRKIKLEKLDVAISENDFYSNFLNVGSIEELKDIISQPGFRRGQGAQRYLMAVNARCPLVDTIGLEIGTYHASKALEADKTFVFDYTPVRDSVWEEEIKLVYVGTSRPLMHLVYVYDGGILEHERG